MEVILAYPAFNIALIATTASCWENGDCQQLWKHVNIGNVHCVCVNQRNRITSKHGSVLVGFMEILIDVLLLVLTYILEETFDIDSLRKN